MKIQSPFVVLGIFLIITGICIIIFSKITTLSEFPGNIIIRNGKFTIYIPVTISIIISVLITIVLNIFLRK